MREVYSCDHDGNFKLVGLTRQLHSFVNTFEISKSFHLLATKHIFYLEVFQSHLVMSLNLTRFAILHAPLPCFGKEGALLVLFLERCLTRNRNGVP